MIFFFLTAVSSKKGSFLLSDAVLAALERDKKLGEIESTAKQFAEV